MLFHVDLIKFHSMHKFCMEHEEEIRKLYEILGGIETSICIAHFRDSLDYYCLPVFHQQKQVVFPAVFLPILGIYQTNPGLRRCFFREQTASFQISCALKVPDFNIFTQP